jgi:hypothetical protein
MNDFIVARDYDNLERRYYDLCVKYGGAQFADEILSLDFKSYESALDAGLQRAIDSLQGPPTYKLPLPEGLPELFTQFNLQIERSLRPSPTSD